MKCYGDGSFETIKMDAKELLDYTISPLPSTVIFRGQSNSKYDLVPRLFRKNGTFEKQLQIANDYLKHENCELSEQITNIHNYVEYLNLRQFYNMANKQGINLPKVPYMYEGAELSMLASYCEDWMPPEWMEIAALAQHYGMPTRLLDWTFDINCAIYFAFDGILKRDNEGTATIWQMDKYKVNYLTGDIKFIVPEYCFNPNILAQSGILTCYRSQLADPYLPLDIHIQNCYESRDAGFKELLMRDKNPIIRRIDIDVNDLIDVYRNFKQRGMLRSRNFPGLKGIIDEIESIYE